MREENNGGWKMSRPAMATVITFALIGIYFWVANLVVRLWFGPNMGDAMALGSAWVFGLMFAFVFGALCRLVYVVHQMFKEILD